MKPLNVSAKTQAFIHAGMILAQFAVAAFVKDPGIKTQIQLGLASIQSSAAVGLQDKKINFDPETNKFTTGGNSPT